jgi:co-chaperonin GroES (HSP10)
MRIAKNTFLVEVDEQFVSPVINGLKFIIDSDFHPKVLATKVGRIHSLPICIGEDYKYDNPLQIADNVIFNHTVCQNNKKFEENVFFCAYYNIYAKINDGSLEPLEDVFFAEKVVEADKNVGGFEVKGRVSDKCAKVFALSKTVADAGVEVGDIIFFTKNADYEMDICGKILYKMHLRNIIGIERNGELKTFRNRLLVKNTTKLGEVGGVEKIYAQTTLQTGVVLTGIPGIDKGTLLTYFGGMANNIEWRGEKYSFIEDRNIKYII